MIMSLFSKYVMFGSGALAATYLIYRFLKCGNKDEVQATNTEVAVLDCIDEDEVLDNVQNGGFEQRIIESDTEDAAEKYRVHAEGVLLWIDEFLAEHYSLNPGPSSYINIKQDILDCLMKSDLWIERNEENVKSYIHDYLSSERNVPVQETNPSPDVSSIPSSDLTRVPDKESSAEDSFDVDQEIDYMCHHYFGITRDEYMALEEEAARKLIEKEDSIADIMSGTSKVSSGLRPKEKELLSNLVSEECARTLDLLDEKGSKVEKKPEKRWKKFKKRISKFFKRHKDSKSK